MHTHPNRGRVAVGILVVAVLVPVLGAGPGGFGPSSPAPVAAQDGLPDPGSIPAPEDGPAVERHGQSRLDAQLLSRTFDAASGTYEIRTLVTLDSRALCIPAVFDCILEPEVDPDGAELVAIDCPGPLWNQLGVFTDVCLKQFFTAGLDQQFRLTYRTLPGGDPDSVTLPVRFGRGFFPILLQELASTELTVALDARLDLTTTCPSDTVDAGATIDCTLSVAFPAVPGAVPVADAAVEVEPTPGSLAGSPALDAQGVAAAQWSCAPTGCELTGDPLEPGDVVEFTWSATAADTPDGGELTLGAELTWPVDRTATASDTVAVAGRTDTGLTVTKTSVTGRARPGDAVEWVVTVENVGVPGRPDVLDARDVVLTDDASRWVTDLVVTPVDGAGAWVCEAAVCRSERLPAGIARFAVRGRLGVDAPVGATMVNQVDVVWANDVFGPGVPAVAGATVIVDAPPAPPEPPAPAPPSPSAQRPPAGLAFAG